MTKNLTKSQIADAKISLREGESLRDVLNRIDADAVPAAPVKHDLAPVPENTSITSEVRSALRALPTVFGSVVVENRRTLSESEISEVYTEFKTLRTIGDTLTRRAEVLKENIRTHVDVDAEDSGLADGATIDASGHYLLAAPKQPVRVSIEGSNEQFSIEYRKGRAGSATVSSEALLAAYEEGQITRDQYLALTRETRVFDEAKASKAIIADPSLLEVVRSASRVTGASEPGSSFFLRKSK